MRQDLISNRICIEVQNGSKGSKWISAPLHAYCSFPSVLDAIELAVSLSDLLLLINFTSFGNLTLFFFCFQIALRLLLLAFFFSVLKFHIVKKCWRVDCC